MKKLATCALVVTLAGCLRVAPVGLGSDGQQSSEEVTPDPATARDGSTDQVQGPSAVADGGTVSDAGAQGRPSEEDEDEDVGSDTEADEGDEEDGIEAPDSDES